MSKRSREEVIFAGSILPDDIWRLVIEYVSPLFLLQPLCRGWPSPTLANDLLVKSMNELCKERNTVVKDWRPLALRMRLQHPSGGREWAEELWRNLPVKKCSLPLYRQFTSLLPLHEGHEEVSNAMIHAGLCGKNCRLGNVFVIQRRLEQESDLLENFCNVFGHCCSEIHPVTRAAAECPIGDVKIAGHSVATLVRNSSIKFSRRSVTLGEGKERQWPGGRIEDYVFFAIRNRQTNAEEVCAKINVITAIRDRLEDLYWALAREFYQLSLLVKK
jgi:hypothetical protein